MSGIKVIEGMEPWEVMKAASEGKRVAFRMKPDGIWTERAIDYWNTVDCDFAIIDDSQSELTAEWWAGFDWGFFNHDRPLTVDHLGFRLAWGGPPAAEWPNTKLRESPFYPWFGGECPVPGNVEVEIVFRDEDQMDCRGNDPCTPAGQMEWDHDGGNADIIAFRLTGNILPSDAG